MRPLHYPSVPKRDQINNVVGIRASLATELCDKSTKNKQTKSTARMSE